MCLYVGEQESLERTRSEPTHGLGRLESDPINHTGQKLVYTGWQNILVIKHCPHNNNNTIIIGLSQLVYIIIIISQRMLFSHRNNVIIFLEHNIIIIPERMFVNLNVVLHRH